LNIAILSRNRHLYSTRSLARAGRLRGHSVRVIDYLRLHMNITSRDPRIYLGRRELDDVDAIIPRIGAQHTFFGTAVVRQFEMMGVYSLNESVGIARARDKLRCLQLLARKGIGLPVTAFAHDPEKAQHMIEICGGAPLVIKLVEGTQGVGVVLAETEAAAESVIEAFRDLDAHILAQQFVSEAVGTDIRAFVIGDKVVAAMRRQAREGEFRANLHRGGKAEGVEVTDAERRAAVAAATALGLNVAGIDLLRSNKGPLVIEVNASPGLEGIQRATRIDVAGKIIEFIEAKAITGQTRTKGRG
jgi:ribosomal protein S6--L-glutamate ligase